MGPSLSELRPFSDLINRAQAAETRGDHASATQEYQAALELARRNPRFSNNLRSVALRGLIQVRFHMQQLDGLETLLREDVDLESKTGDARNFKLAEAFAELGILSCRRHEAEADDLFSRAITTYEQCQQHPYEVQAKSPTFCSVGLPIVRAFRGVCLTNRQQDAAAEVVLSQVLALSPNRLPASLMLDVLQARTILLARDKKEEAARDMAQRIYEFRQQHPELKGVSEGKATPDDLAVAGQLRDIVSAFRMGEPVTSPVPSGPHENLLRAFQGAVADWQQSFKGEQQNLAALHLDALFLPANLSDLAHLQEGRRKLSAALVIQDRITLKREGSIKRFEEMFQKDAQASGDAEKRANASGAFVLGYAPFWKQIETVEQNNRLLIQMSDRLLRFLEQRQGNYTLQDNILVFRNDDDLQFFNRGVLQIQQFAVQVAAQQKSLMEQQELRMKSLGVPPASSPSQP